MAGCVLTLRVIPVLVDLRRSGDDVPCPLQVKPGRLTVDIRFSVVARQ